MARAIRNNQILLIKMTPGERSEGRALAKGRSNCVHCIGSQTTEKIAHKKDVLVVKDSKLEDRIFVGNNKYNLEIDADRKAFVKQLNLKKDQSKIVCKVLSCAEKDSKDELAQVTRILNWAEQGKLNISRLVLSGHYYWFGIRGDYGENGYFSLLLLEMLLKSFPIAACSIKHLMFASCFSDQNKLEGSSKKISLATYQRIFPNLISITAYRGKAPKSGLGSAERDLRKWAIETRNKNPKRNNIFGLCKSDHGSSKSHDGVLITQKGTQSCKG